MKDSMLQSERMAAIGRISARITHEIRNPLSSIQLNTEMLYDELQDEKVDLDEMRPITQAIIREVQRLYDITESYLKMGRMPKKEMSRVEINRLLSNLAEFYRTEMSKLNVDCRLDVMSDHLYVQADENQLVQAMHNLIKNGLEAMEDGGVLTLTSKIDGDSCRLEISDSGKGIPENILEKVFDPFFSTKKGGTGLGLAMVRKVVEDTGGSIDFESDVDKGTTFILNLPLLKRDVIEN